MKKLILLLSLFFFILSSNIFSQTADVTVGCAPLQVNFTSPLGSSTYFWDFADGSSSNLQNPSNTFTTAGTYNVIFKNTPTGPTVGTITITVHNKPVPTYTTSSTLKGCVPLTISLSDNTILPTGVIATGYNWSMGNGSGLNGQNVNYTYSTSGVYDISLSIVTNMPSCNNNISTFDNIVSCSNPIASFFTNPNPAQACTAPLTVSFTNISSSTIPLTYAWDFGNTNTSTLQNPTSQTYNSEGQFTVTLTITDTNNCSKTTTTNISIGSPTADFTIPDTVCKNQLFTIDNLSSTGLYSWTFGGGSTIPTSTQFEPSLMYSSGGNKTIQLIVSSANGQCKDTLIKTIFVEDPTGTLTSNPTYSCSNPTNVQFTFNTTSNIATWDWLFGDDSTSNIANPLHTYIISDSAFDRTETYYFTTTLNITTANGCTFQTSTVDTVSLIFARPMPNITQGCAPLSVTFSDSTFSERDIVSWLYNFGDGTTINYTNSGTQSHVYNTPGVYYVTMKATNDLGCFDISDTIVIKVGTTLPLDFTINNTLICPGDSISFTNISANQNLFSGWNFSTDGELLSKCYNKQPYTYAFDDTTGTFDVTISGDYNGCISTFTKSNAIQVKGPIAKFDYLYNCDSPNNLQLIDKSNDAQTILWEISDGTTDTQNNFTHTFSGSGDYLIKLTASNPGTGCPNSIDTVIFNIRNINSDFPISNTYCGKIISIFDGSSSTDVNATCHAGYEWIFSDSTMRPTTSDSPTGSFTFNTSGTQTIGLITKDINGCKDTLVKTIYVYNVTPDFTVSDFTICIPDTLSYTNLTVSDTTILSYSWNFGDMTSSALSDPTHIFTSGNPGIIPVTLTVTDVLGCQKNITKNLTVYKPTSTIISPSIVNKCSGESVIFQATDYTSQGSNLNYIWNFNDGSGTSNANPTTHPFNGQGSYTVKLIYQENSSGCKDSTTKIINIQDYPVASIDLPSDTLCANVITSFTNNTAGIVSSNWSVSGGLLTNSTNSTITLPFPKGNYTVQLIATTTFGCKDTIIKSISVFGPEGDFSINNNNICQGDSITFNIIDTVDVGNYSWDFGDGTSGSAISPITHEYNFLPPSGQTVAKLVVYSGMDLCPVTAEKNIFIHYVKADFERNGELDTIICLGDVLNLTNSSINSNTFQWDFGNGTTSNTSNTELTVNYSTSDTFDITIISYNSQFGCTDTTMKQIIIADLPNFISYNDTICYGNTANLILDSVQNQYIYSWIPSDLLNNDSIQNPIANPSETQIFTIIVTDTITGCSTTQTPTVFVIQPLNDINFDTTIVVGDFVNLPIENQSGLVNFTWTPTDGLSCLDCSNPQVQPLNEITYEVIMEDVLGCSQANGTFIIKIHPETFIELPTTFTPNGDGVNDKIYVKGWGVKDLIYFQIYNRWGELVFETSEITEGWDGYYKGKLQNNDIYTYKVKAGTWRNEEIEKNGFINLMR